MRKNDDILDAEPPQLNSRSWPTTRTPTLCQSP